MKIPSNVLCATVEKILETMYFCEAECAGPGSLALPALGSRVAISGELKGELIVVATSGMALRMAADFVAADVADMTRSQAAEIVHELANVACGAALADIAPTAKLTFSVPCDLREDEAAGPWPQRFRIDEAADAELAVSLVLEAR